MPPGLSNTDLANAALIKLGETTIGNLTNTTTLARLVNSRFQSVRDSVLRSHNWNVATRRATLSLIANTPPFEFDFAYGLPEGLVKVVEITGDDFFVPVYRVEQHNTGSDASPNYVLALLTDIDAPQLKYIVRIDADIMDDLLFNMIAVKLAFDLSLKLSKSEATRQALRAEFKELGADARFADASEQSASPWYLDTWEQSRIGGSGEPLGDATFRQMRP